VPHFTFATAGRIVFGAGESDQLPSLVATSGARPFVCTGGHPERHAALLERIGGAVHPIANEPTFDDLRTATDAASEHGADVVVGLGGGAVLDAAKAVAALLANPGDPLDYAEVVGWGKPLLNPSLPCVAVPTTSGTGSEVTANAVLTSVEHGVKVSLRSPSMLPRIALVDPDLTLGCPPAVTAHAGLDALIQCIEPFVSPFATPLTDGFCREGSERAGRSLRRAVADGSDRDARADLSLTSLFSGLALANAKLGAAHGLAGPLGGLLGAPHGALTAAVMVEVSRANLAALAGDPDGFAVQRYAEVGGLLTGHRSPEAFLEWFAESVEAFGLGGLASLGLRPEQVYEVADAARRSSSIKGNPVQLPVETLEAVLHASMG
jgi:alcohol dehydrogenase class IV